MAAQIFIGHECTNWLIGFGQAVSLRSEQLDDVTKVIVDDFEFRLVRMNTVEGSLPMPTSFGRLSVPSGADVHIAPRAVFYGDHAKYVVANILNPYVLETEDRAKIAVMHERKSL